MPVSNRPMFPQRLVTRSVRCTTAQTSHVALTNAVLIYDPATAGGEDNGGELFVLSALPLVQVTATALWLYRLAAGATEPALVRTALMAAATPTGSTENKPTRFADVSLYGQNKDRSRRSMLRSEAGASAGYGGHFRAVQGFRYVEGA